MIGISVKFVTMMMVTVTPVIARVSTVHIVRRVQFLRQIIQLERMVGNLLLDLLLTRTDKTNTEVSGWSHHRWARSRRMKNALRFAATGVLRSITLKEGIISDVIIPSIRSALEFRGLTFLAASPPARVLFAQIGLHLVGCLHFVVFWMSCISGGVLIQRSKRLWYHAIAASFPSFCSFQSPLVVVVVGETSKTLDDDQNGQDQYIFSAPTARHASTAAHFVNRNRGSTLQT